MKQSVASKAGKHFVTGVANLAKAPGEGKWDFTIYDKTTLESQPKLLSFCLGKGITLREFEAMIKSTAKELGAVP